MFKTPGETHTICYWNTRSYWPTAYSPTTNSLYTSYIDNCRELTTAGPANRGEGKVVPRPGSDPKALTGLAKINLSTGEILRFDVGRAPGNGAMLATAGDLVFHGDMSRRFRAFDAATGKQLWESILGGNISVSTISYAVNGKQYIAVMTGDNLKVPELAAEVPEMKTPRCTTRSTCLPCLNAGRACPTPTKLRHTSPAGLTRPLAVARGSTLPNREL